MQNRFTDNGVEEIRPTDTSPHIVEFYPAIEDYVYLAEINAKRYPLPSIGKLFLQAFIFLNAFGLPVVLFYFDYVLTALIVFGLNVSLSVVFIPALFRTDYRRYYRIVSPDLENEVIRVELHPDGLLSQRGADNSFHTWKSVKSVEETKDAIFFVLTGGHGLAVRKTGFAYDADKRAFVTFAKRQMKMLLPNNESERN
jgi:hypothetical protein